MKKKKLGKIIRDHNYFNFSKKKFWEGEREGSKLPSSQNKGRSDCSQSKKDSSS